MKKIIAFATATALAFSILTPDELSAKSKQPEVSGLELQQIQTRDFEAPKDMVFASVMSVLQDSGYRIQSADLETGLITGVGSAKGKITYNLFWGFGKKKKSPVASVFIEKIGPEYTRVRISFVVATVKATVYSSQPADEDPVTDAAVYAQAFEQVEQAVFLRQSMATQSPRTVPETQESVETAVEAEAAAE